MSHSSPLFRHAGVLGTAMVCALLAIVEADARDTPASASLAEAQALRDQGHLQESAAIYERLIQANPGAWEPRYEVAQIYMTLKQLGLAELQLQAGILAWPQQAALWARLGQVYLLKSDLQSAERALTRARELNPSDSGVHYNLAKIYERGGRDAEALAEYIAFLERAGSDPMTVGVRRHLVLYYENTHQFSQVVDQYRALVAIDPDNPQFHQGLADYLYKQSSFDEAYTEYQKVIALDPNNVPALFNLGFINKMRGHLQEAMDYFKRSDTLSPGSAKTLYQIGALQFESGDYSAAAAAFEKVIALEPEHSQAHYSYSRALAKLGRMDEARHELQIHQEILKKIEEKKPSTSMERP